VKPVSSAGSDGVELVTDTDGYREIAQRRAAERPLLVESAVDGPEFSWEALVRDGDVWCSNTTAKTTTGPPQFVEVAHRTGVQLDLACAAAVEQLGHEVIAALRMRTGIIHLEFRIAAGGPTVMEVAVRTPGDFLMELLSITYGVDWFEMLVRAALSWPLPSPPARPVQYAASYLPVAEAGVVTSVRGLAKVAGHPCIVRAEVSVRAGDEVAPLQSSDQRVGHVVLAAPTQDELEQALEFVRSTLRVCTRPL
jgi:biotin carboxylase